MDSSNNPNPVADTVNEAANPVENSVSQETTQNVSPAPDASPEAPKAELSLSEKIKALSKAPLDPTAPKDPAAPEVPAPPAFQPNWKYKAFGKEKEIDPFWQPLVKDADSEKKVKDLFTRAEAFDDLKTRHDGTQKNLQEVMGDYQALDKDVRKVLGFKQSGDLDNFFGALKITDEQIFDYARKKLEMAQMPPEQRLALERQAQERLQIHELQEQNQTLEQTYQTQAVQARTMQLDMVLWRPEVQSAASAWDQKTGQIGSFRDLIIEEGQRHAFSTGEDLPAEHVVNMVLQKFGKFITEPQAQNAPVQAQVTPNIQAAPQAPPPGTTQVVTKPVIPTASGRGTSPVSRSPKSLDDLKQMAKEMAASGQ